MQTLKVVNIKCGGCENSIKLTLKKNGLKNIKVDHTCQEVSFEGDKDTARTALSKMGYPEAGSPESEKFTKKAKSYISCMIGKVKK
ncbi:heavy-metal-associated domain-containing protein [bacterium]|nr:heavy-metal-associated domain-containing protein [bacterium]